jgi:glyceraldehyde 3-phosphate dehydrogenase
MAVRVSINGFGRIGRNVLRAIYESKRTDIEVVAINDLGPVETNAHLLRFDSVHGRFPGDVTVDGDSIQLGNGNKIKVTAVRDPNTLPWKDLGIDIALECTGIFSAKAKATSHLTAGAKRVLVSAPSDGADATIVYGVNHKTLTKEHLVVSNGSCTTNCLAPVAKVLNETVGIETGFMTTIHAYTGDQPTLDTLHSDLYRGRAAAMSMIPTSTGAAKAIGLVMPELAGKLDGVSIRVPTPNVSVVDLKIIAKRSTTKEEINEAIKKAAARRAEGRARHHFAPERVDRLQSRSAFVDLRLRPDQGAERHAGAGTLLVRQRVGLLQPHGRHRRRDGQAALRQRPLSRAQHKTPRPGANECSGPRFAARRSALTAFGTQHHDQFFPHPRRRRCEGQTRSRARRSQRAHGWWQGYRRNAA